MRMRMRMRMMMMMMIWFSHGGGRSGCLMSVLHHGW